jgi:hypothetical protein
MDATPPRVVVMVVVEAVLEAVLDWVDRVAEETAEGVGW